ncbi:sodium:proton antiporter [Corallincola holothuriorum]|uniref:Sodium:proton antiporter n=1 Tax=Corallincola holothuriorum TaxID=2282215 RepID=A0A368NJS7_9GAMM|nr:Na+/H+ antiporter family protein [Corallincola holothuriorum]RCU50396.1 sodium:proton antiporter [Corallincola holothuriorum]
MNAVVLSVLLVLTLSLFRVNVVIALIVSALAGGLIGGLSLSDTLSAFNGGLGNGASIALSYAMLGAFAAALSNSGITDYLADHVINKLGGGEHEKQKLWAKHLLLFALLAVSVSSQNIIPVHIAFIPILVPPLLHLMSELKLDRRLVACVITFGLTTPYMLLPVGFGGIFLNEILLTNLNTNGLAIDASAVAPAMLLPACGMFIGLGLAMFSYRKKRHYDEAAIKAVEPEQHDKQPRQVWVPLAAIAGALVLQLLTESIVIGSLTGLIILWIGRSIRLTDTQALFSQGVKMMGMIGFIMISAAGYAAVLKGTGDVESLVSVVSGWMGESKALAAITMLVIGLLITMGIGSSFSTIPVIATLYVPLAISLGFSVPATIALVGTAAALGDAGSPASDSTLGPTSGLNVDGQHDHIWDTVVPTFIHYNLPLLGFGWLAAMVL